MCLFSLKRLPPSFLLRTQFHFFAFLPLFTYFTSHQFLFFSPGNVPRRDNIVSFLPSCTSLYVPVHVCMYGYLCTHTSLAPMSRDTAQRSGGETFDSILVRFSDWNKSYSERFSERWEGGESDSVQPRWRHPASRLNFPMENILPQLLQNVTEKVQLN